MNIILNQLQLLTSHMCCNFKPPIPGSILFPIGKNNENEEGGRLTCWSGRRGGSSFLPFGRLHGHTPNKGVVDTHQDVLWLDVRVDDLTFSVEVVQTLQDLQTHSDEHVLTLCAFVRSFFISLPLIHSHSPRTEKRGSGCVCSTVSLLRFCPEAFEIELGNCLISFLLIFGWLLGSGWNGSAASLAHQVADGGMPDSTASSDGSGTEVWSARQRAQYYYYY